MFNYVLTDINKIIYSLVHYYKINLIYNSIIKTLFEKHQITSTGNNSILATKGKYSNILSSFYIFLLESRIIKI